MALFDEIGDFFDEYSSEVGMVGGAIIGGAVTGGNPIGIAAGASIGGSLGQSYETSVSNRRQAARAARIERETKARERALLISTRREAMEGAPRVQYGGRLYGGPSPTEATDALAPNSLLTRGTRTGLNILNPSLGVP